MKKFAVLMEFLLVLVKNFKVINKKIYLKRNNKLKFVYGEGLKLLLLKIYNAL